MSRPGAIRARGIGKKYHIGALQETSYDTLRDRLVEAAKAPFRRARKLIRGQATGAAELDDEFWALKDITFDVDPGDVVGVVGANGAGKSTLLKVLSRITEPTEGYAEIHGRVSSLLEVGTGFHPELTGRENVYLNGAILGMTRAEIEAKFDEIVDFAELRKFIDTPVKHYSSGMYVRLAFAVAAHLEPEILLVDEVLSVGDAAFQRKCLGKMEDVAGGGRTILFVSHNMGAVTNLCERVIYLRDGRIVRDGPAREVVSEYLSSGAAMSGLWVRPEDHPPDEEAEIREVRVLHGDDPPSGTVPFDDGFRIEIDYRVKRPLRPFAVMCRLEDPDGTPIWTSWDTDTTGWDRRVREPGAYTSVCHVPRRLMRPGRYFVTVGPIIRRRRHIELHERAVGFEVSNVGFNLNPRRQGVVTPLLDWDVARDEKVPGDAALAG